MSAISQWPTVVSLPFDFSESRANAADGVSVLVPHVTPSMLKSPSAPRFGSAKRGLFEQLKSVLLPASPKRAASGISPMPTLSSTIKNTRFARILLLLT